jgi:hypothetical protein
MATLGSEGQEEVGVVGRLPVPTELPAKVSRVETVWLLLMGIMRRVAVEAEALAPVEMLALMGATGVQGRRIPSLVHPWFMPEAVEGVVVS